MGGTWKEQGTASVTLSSGTAVYTSDAVSLPSWDKVGVIFGTLTTGTMQLDVSNDNSTYRALKGSNDAAVTIYGGTGPGAVYVAELAPWPWARVRHTATQSADRAIVFVHKS